MITPGDQKQIDRFAAFLRIVEAAEHDEHGCRIVTTETKRYALGEDVDPVPVDGDHLGMWTLWGPTRARRVPTPLIPTTEGATP